MEFGMDSVYEGDGLSGSWEATQLVQVEEQHENLRRFVDEWGWHVKEILQDAHPHRLGPATFGYGDVGGGFSDVIIISAEPQEHAQVHELITTDNVPFNKVMIVLAYDCCEIGAIQERAASFLYPHLLTFALRPNPDDGEPEGEAQSALARSLGVFHELLANVARLRALLVNLLAQLGAVYPPDASQEGQLFASFRDVRLPAVAGAIAEALGVLVTLDAVVTQNRGISHCIASYVRMLETMRESPGEYEMAVGKVEALDRAIQGLEEIVLPPGFFQRFVQEDLCMNPATAGLRANRKWQEELSHCVSEQLSRLSSRSGTLSEKPRDRERLAGLLATVGLLSWMSEQPDKRLVKAAWDVHRRAPLLPLVGCVSLLPCAFLSSALSPAALALATTQSKDALRDAAVARKDFLSNLDESLAKDLPSLTLSVLSWITRFESALPTKVDVKERLWTQLRQLSQGVAMASRLRLMLLTAMELHAAEAVPISKEQLHLLTQLVELVKAIEETFARRGASLAQALGHTIRLAQEEMRSHLLPLKVAAEDEVAASESRGRGLGFLARTITRGKDAAAKSLDTLAAVNLALSAIEGCGSRQRRTIFRIAFDVVTGLSKVKEDTAAHVRALQRLLTTACKAGRAIREACDCSFLYWHRHVMGACFARYYTHPQEARQLRYAVAAFLDGARLMRTGAADHSATSAYESEVSTNLCQAVLEPVCRDIETDLRLHIHSANLKGAVNVNPTKTGVRDLLYFLQVPPIRVSSTIFNFKERVEEYLDETFYNHAAVALHSWKTYEEMRALAEEKYELQLAEIQLPGHTIEQGLDILEITRNIHLFSATFAYNLNTQVFVERPSAASTRERKYLNTVGARHVADSLRTHGRGTTHTTVNVAYQFLAHKFVALSQFLFDDHIKSSLLTELRFCQERNMGIGNRYPVARAEKINKDIRRLGVSESGQSFLDQFRGLVTEIGNALGFVRLVRTGGLQFVTSAASFLPEPLKEASFQAAAEEGGQNSQRNLEAARALDAAVRNLREGTSAAHTDYLSILVNVFASELRTEDNAHMRSFHVIVPALTINAIEAMIRAKERAQKRGGKDAGATLATFTDDGLPLGIAYLLKVLGQDEVFDSLHWFESLRLHVAGEREGLESRLDMDGGLGSLEGLQRWSRKAASLSPEEAHNFQLVVKRLTCYMMEVELLEYTLNAARILFS